MASIEHNKPRFDKTTSQAIKGIAILMMLAHHCFGFPEYWMQPVAVSALTVQIASGFKICVAIFAFITGYGFYHSAGGRMPRKVFRFLLQYWMQLFVIFLPIACVNFRFSPIRILRNMLAIYDNVILFAWYVFFHLIVLVTFPFVKKLLSRNLIQDLLIVLIGGYGCTVVLYLLPTGHFFRQVLVDCSVYYPTVGMGYIFAKHRLFDILIEKMRYPLPSAILMVVAVFVLRSQISVIKGFTFDCFYAPCLITALICLLSGAGVAKCVFVFLGKYSFHMWLFHSIFFSAYTRELVQPLVSWSDMPFVRFLMVTGLSTLAAYLIQHLFDFLFACKGRIRTSVT